eukprot:4919302-Alexandrium_andersonii.AAC.1
MCIRDRRTGAPAHAHVRRRVHSSVSARGGGPMLHWVTRLDGPATHTALWARICVVEHRALVPAPRTPVQHTACGPPLRR